MNTKIIACTVGFALFGWAAFAETFTAIKDASDWSKKESFTVNGEPATRTPGADDTIYLNQDATWSFTAGTESFNVMANVKEIRFETWRRAKIEITVPNDTTADVNCVIGPAFATRDTSLYRFCDIIKRGEGTLRFVCDGSYYLWGFNTCIWNVYSNVRVKEGAVRFFPDSPIASSYIGVLEVAKGAKAYMPNKSGSDYTFQLRGLVGEGDVVNDTDKTVTFDSMPANKEEEHVFSGEFVEASTGLFKVRWSGPQRVTGGKSSYGGSTMIWANGAAYTTLAYDGYGVTVTDQLGMRGQPSSFGAGSEINFQWLGGALWYGGSGETTDKKFVFQVPGEDNKVPCTFCAGDVGGVTFDGSDYSQTLWCAGDTSGSGYFHDVRVILAGDNANPMRILCPVLCGTYYFNGKKQGNMTPYFLKRGSGAWSFENDASTMFGSFEIEEGTIRFTSIEETGYVSSLGKATALYNFLDGTQTRAALDASKVSPFAVKLAATNAATRGTLEHIGGKATGSSDRLIGLAGFGGKIANNGQGTLLLNGVTVCDVDLATTLVLGGTNASENLLLNVTNGVGSIALVKEDSGKWILADDVDVDSVEVKGGTLVLERTTGKSYTWFKFIMQEARNYNPEKHQATAASWPCLEEFILQDADGNRVFTNPTSYDKLTLATAASGNPEWYIANGDAANYHGIPPNGMAYGKRGGKIASNSAWRRDKSPEVLDDRFATNLFDNVKSWSAGGFWPGNPFAGSYTKPTVADESSWVPVVMRLQADAPHVASCDLVAANGGGWENELSAWQLEGSRDGITWEVITNYDSKVIMPSVGTPQEDGFNMHRSGNEYWSLVDQYGRSAKKSTWTPGETKAPHPNGYPFPGVVTNEFAFPTSLDFVKISGGGTLKIDSTVPVTIDTLTVDATTGGSIVNGTFAETGTLNLENVGDEKSITVPGSLAGLDLEDWTVNLPQGAKHRIVSMKGDQLTITKSGILLIVR